MSQQLLPLVAAANLEPWTLRPEMAAAADLRTACANLQNNSEDGMHSGMRQNAVSTAKSSLLAFLDACTYSVLYHGVKTCDDTHSSYILVRLAGQARSMFPTSRTLGPTLCDLSVALVLACLLTMTDRNP